MRFEFNMYAYFKKYIQQAKEDVRVIEKRVKEKEDVIRAAHEEIKEFEKEKAQILEVLKRMLGEL